MIPLPAPSRTLARWLLLLPAALLLFGLIAAGLHHHAPGEDAHACALCALGQTPAIAAEAPPAPALTRLAGVGSTAAPAAPRARRAGPRACRAPPAR
jgi:uncharacterized SAM-binding protein YcdF (DUF218 family)